MTSRTLDRASACVGQIRRSLCGSLAGCAVALSSVTSTSAAQIETLADLSLEELGNLEVTSVSKAAEALRSAPSSIYVITHDEIVRSGATSIPEALRLAPNLQIIQYSSSNYVAGARGFGGAQEAQNFSNKLLVLIDGRSVYTPLYSGVYFDMQDVLLEDIDRIEVISGPGATLWGANAMNGVINIITRSADLTTGGFASASSGNVERNVSARFGDDISSGLAYRVYGRAFEQEAMELESGASARDDWRKAQGGFRVDWTGADDSVTAQGDIYRGEIAQPDVRDIDLKGANVLARWQHRSARSEIQLQAYHDRTERAQPIDGAAFVLRTYDIELQQRIDAGPRHRIVWGAGSRWHDYEIDGSQSLLFEPAGRSISLGNVFVQDTIALTERLDLTLGWKFEDAAFSGWESLPDLRLAWRVSDDHLLWAAASRAIRAATPFDRDVIERSGGMTLLVGNASFQPEQVDAYQFGYRGQPFTNLALSISSFYNVHENLRTVEWGPPPTFLPLTWGNNMEGETYGVEAWAKWQVNEWWRLSPGVRLLRTSLELEPDTIPVLGLEQAGNDPRWQGLLTSSMDLPHGLTFDATLRYVDELPAPALPSYRELNAALAWRMNDRLTIVLSGLNLLDSTHQEYPAPAGQWIRRSVLATARVRF
jgi:iron complex outermembrane receptor protein